MANTSQKSAGLTLVQPFPHPMVDRKGYLEELRLKGAQHLPKAMKTWLDGMAALDKEGNADWGIRLKAAAEFADRCGLPKRAEVIKESAPVDVMSVEQMRAKIRDLMPVIQGGDSAASSG